MLLISYHTWSPPPKDAVVQVFSDTHICVSHVLYLGMWILQHIYLIPLQACTELLEKTPIIFYGFLCKLSVLLQHYKQQIIYVLHFIYNKCMKLDKREQGLNFQMHWSSFSSLAFYGDSETPRHVEPFISPMNEDYECSTHRKRKALES